MSCSITVRCEFDYAHRIRRHKGKCASLHGHRGVVELTIAGPLGHLDMVADFGEVKRGLQTWINSYWDHNAIFKYDDPLIKFMQETDYKNKVPYVMDCEPTAENMAKELYKAMTVTLHEGGIITQVKFWETPNCSATYVPIEAGA